MAKKLVVFEVDEFPARPTGALWSTMIVVAQVLTEGDILIPYTLMVVKADIRHIVRNKQHLLTVLAGELYEVESRNILMRFCTQLRRLWHRIWFPLRGWPGPLDEQRPEQTPGSSAEWTDDDVEDDDDDEL